MRQQFRRMNAVAIPCEQDFASLLSSVKRIAHEVAAPNAADVDAAARFPRETVQALRDAEVLSAAAPREFGGAGCTVTELAQLCATLAQSCGASAMVLAMHYIQLGCVARHAQGNDFFAHWLRGMVHSQWLLGSAGIW